MATDVITKRAKFKNVGVHESRPFTSPIASMIVTVIAVLWTVPTFGLVVTSFRSKEDILSTGWWHSLFNWKYTLDNYRAVLFESNGTIGTQGMIPFAVNSLAITIPSVLLSVGLGLMAAYALAWVPFKYSDHIFYGLFALQGVPLQLSLLPLLTFFATGVQIFGITIFPKLHIVGTLASVWLPHTMFGLPLVIYLLHNFVAALPREVMEAARVDGANHFETFRKIVLPLSLPAIASIAIFQFLWVWNDYLIAFIFLPNNPVMTYRILLMMGQYGAGWQDVAAGSLISLTIPLLVFFSLQRYFIRGLTAGSVK